MTYDDSNTKRTIFYTFLLIILVAFILFVASAITGNQDMLTSSFANILV